MSGAELEPAAVPPPATDLQRIARLGQWLAAAESGSRDPSALGAASALRIAWGEHLGVSPTEIHIIKGTVSLSTKAFRARAHKYGLSVIPVEETADSCTAAVIDNKTGRELGRRTYTLSMAKRQGLGGTAWTQTPDMMLFARASKRAMDIYCPWVTAGIAALEEVDEQPEYVAAPDDEVLSGEVVDEIPFGDAD